MYIKFIIIIIIIINIMISFETYYYIFILLRNVMCVYIDMQCTYIYTVSYYFISLRYERVIIYIRSYILLSNDKYICKQASVILILIRLLIMTTSSTHKMNLFAQELKRFFNAAGALEGIDALRCEMVRSYFNSPIGD